MIMEKMMKTYKRDYLVAIRSKGRVRAKPDKRVLWVIERSFKGGPWRLYSATNAKPQTSTLWSYGDSTFRLVKYVPEEK